MDSKLRQLIDEWETLDDARLAANRAATEATTAAEQAKQKLIAELGESNLSGAGGSHIMVEVVPKVVPTVGDWSAVYQYITENNAFDLLQKRVGMTAARARWDDGIEIPGISQTEIPNLKRRKLT